MTSSHIQTKGTHSTHRPNDVMLHTDQRNSFYTQTRGRHATFRPKEPILHTDQRSSSYTQTKGRHATYRPKDLMRVYTNGSVNREDRESIHWKTKVRSLSKKKVLLAGDASRLTSAGRFVASTHCIMSYPPSHARLSLVTDFDTQLYCSPVARGTHTHKSTIWRSSGVLVGNREIPLKK